MYNPNLINLLNILMYNLLNSFLNIGQHFPHLLCHISAPVHSECTIVVPLPFQISHKGNLFVPLFVTVSVYGRTSCTLVREATL